MRRALPLIALPLALAGCVSRGERPPPPAAAAIAPPPAWRTAPGPGGPVSADWWRGFGDPALAALVERALANNLDIAIAATRVEEARAAEALARAQRLPQVGGALPETQGQTLSRSAPPRARWARSRG